MTHPDQQTEQTTETWWEVDTRRKDSTDWWTLDEGLRYKTLASAEKFMRVVTEEMDFAYRIVECTLTRRPL